jgi:hypothetical protein
MQETKSLKKIAVTVYLCQLLTPHHFKFTKQG